jgi:hypothetical protein
MIRKIISNSVYRGMVRVRTSASDTEVAEGDLPIWEEYKGKHVAIVSDDLWARANARLKRAEPVKLRTPHRFKGSSMGLLTGMVRCGRCKCAMSPGAATKRRRTGEIHRYYRCTLHMKAGEHSECTTKGISADALESTVLNLISSLESNPANFSLLGANTSRRGREAEIAQSTAELNDIERQIKEGQGHVDRLVQFVRESGSRALATEMVLAAEQAKDQGVELENRKIQIEAKLQGLSNKTPAIAELSHAFGLISRALALADHKNKNAIYLRVIKSVSVESARWLPGIADVVPANRRSFRVIVSFKTDEVLQFGGTKLDQVMGKRGYSDIDLAVTMEIKSNRKEQKVILLEHAYSFVSASYGIPEQVPLLKDPVGENPVQRAVRWHAALKVSNMQAKDLAKQEGVSKASMSQHLALLDLPQPIFDFMREGRDRGLKQSLSFRELHRLLAMAPADAIVRFQSYISGAPLQETLALKSE